jgi:hypothetical protein
MKKLIVFAVFCFSQAAFGQLQAPYLYTADSVADTAFQLTWRNNSAAYVGIIVLRKASATGQYGAVDTAPGTATSLIDIVKPAAQTTYFYALTAYSQTAHADTSNSDSVVVKPRQKRDFLMKPLNLTIFLDSLRRTVQLRFLDTSTSEIGVKIYRSTNFGTFTILADIPSGMLLHSVENTPTQPTPKYVNIIFADSSTVPNTWYVYYVASYDGQQELGSEKDTLFTVDVPEILKNIPRKCTILDSITSFPASPGGWCLKYHDTIVLNERNRPDSTTFSIIDMSNPAAPRFAGTGKSDAARIVFGSEFLCKDNFVISMKGGIVNRYEYDGGGIFPAPVTANQPFAGDPFLPGFLTDSTLLAQYTFSCGAGPCYENVDARFRFSRNVVSFLDTASDLSQWVSAGSVMGGVMTGPGWTYGNRYYANSAYNFNVMGSTTSNPNLVLVTDFNYPGNPRCLVNTVHVVSFPKIIDNILIDTTKIPWSQYVFIDTVRNLVYAVFYNQLSVYNCRIEKTGISAALHTEQFVQPLRICKRDGFQPTLILLPHHTQPCALSIFDVSGRRIALMDGIRGETVAWPNQKRTGVYILRAIIDGNAVTAKVILNK